MKLFALILFFCLFALNSYAQTCDDSEYLSSEYVQNEFLCSEEKCNTIAKINPLSIYPNPTTDYFEVKNWVNIEGYLFDITGRLLRKVDCSKMVNITDFANGIYFLQVGNQIKKIVKQ